MKIQIESPLVNITFEDEYVMHNGYTMHRTPTGDEIPKLVDKLKDACSQIILEHIKAKKYGIIDLSKLNIPKDANEIKVTLE